MSRLAVIWDPATGRIMKTVGGSEQVIRQNMPPGMRRLHVPAPVNEALFRIERVGRPRIIPRPAMPVTLPSVVTIGEPISLDVPAGAEVRVECDHLGLADADGVELVFESLGLFLVEVELWPYVTLLARIEVR